MNRHQYGFFKIAAAVPAIKVADIAHNKKEILKLIEDARKEEVSLLAFPELCLTAASCESLFGQKVFLNAAKKAILEIAEASSSCRFPILIGSPFLYRNQLYNGIFVIIGGEIRSIISKQILSARESAYFSSLTVGSQEYIDLQADNFACLESLSSFADSQMENFSFSVEIGEDSKALISPSSLNRLTKINIIVNPAALPAKIGSPAKKKEELMALSAKNNAIYLHVNAGFGESTTSHVYSGYSVILEAGRVIAESRPYQNQSHLLIGLVDLDKIESLKSAPAGHSLPGQMEQLLIEHFGRDSHCHWYHTATELIPDTQEPSDPFVARPGRFPFIPESPQELENNCREIIDILCLALEKRFLHVNNRSSVLGVSGGLDSTLALLLLIEAYQRMGKKLTEIIGVRMPGFGTSGKTYQNSCRLMALLGITPREVDIKASVLLHLKDIGHPLEAQDITYENAQARERTQILMDIANQTGGLVIGTGDLSELALGFCTYNGDHMSMYSVNASIPKTLIPYLIRSLGRQYQNPEILRILEDIIDTPISPELLPPNANQIIQQKTEELIGPYALHDFFLYYMLRYGFSPQKIRALAIKAFEGIYPEAEINHWLKLFYRRFFSQQFKRNCLPDSPVLGSITLFDSFKMPSDASAALWLDDLFKEEKNE